MTQQRYSRHAGLVSLAEGSLRRAYFAYRNMRGLSLFDGGARHYLR